MRLEYKRLKKILDRMDKAGDGLNALHFDGECFLEDGSINMEHLRDAYHSKLMFESGHAEGVVRPKGEILELISFKGLTSKGKKVLEGYRKATVEEEEIYKQMPALSSEFILLKIPLKKLLALIKYKRSI